MSALAAPQPQRPVGGSLVGSLSSIDDAEGADEPGDSSSTSIPGAHFEPGRSVVQAGMPCRTEEDGEGTIKGRAREPTISHADLACKPNTALEIQTRFSQPASPMSHSLYGSSPEHNRSHDGHLHPSPLHLPPSPSCSVASSMGGYSQAESDYEPLDSPSSLSSWNSFVAPGVRRGDLADVEDLDLDGGSILEPELETVSECDEENAASSADITVSPKPATSEGKEATSKTPAPRHGLGLEHGSAFAGRRRVSGGTALASHAVQHATQHSGISAAAPLLPHFSPRNGGHGLSHASRHVMRAPPGLAARRRKGRVAELLDEGTAGEVTSTAPPSSNPTVNDIVATRDLVQADVSTPTVLSAKRRASRGSVGPAPSRSAAATPPLLVTPPTSTEEEVEASPATPTPFSHSQAWNEFEFTGPPALPPRCVSPSETVPAVPSPLCECISVDEEAAQTQAENKEDSPGIDASVETIKPHNHGLIAPSPLSKAAVMPSLAAKLEAASAVPETADSERHASAPASPTRTATGSDVSCTRTASSIADTSPPTTPPGTPNQRPRSNSGRDRRSSSPTKTKPKVPLRPCFRRRASAQSTQSMGRLSSCGMRSGMDSSSESESVTSTASRGRAHVRFSPGPPESFRTHSPVEYDRKACLPSNRLSPEDVEELRDMHVEMGLLEAKWAAMASSKTRTAAQAASSSAVAGSEDESATEEDQQPIGTGGSLVTGEDGFPLSSPSSSLLAPPPLGAASNNDRKRADSIASSSPSTFCRNRFTIDSSLPNSPDRATDKAAVSPAEHLRLEREKERERALRFAGIGTGTGFRYNSRSQPNGPGGCFSRGYGEPGAPAGRQTSPIIGAARPEVGCCPRPSGAASGAVNPLIARFGLSKPPPPLPGMSRPTASAPSSVSGSPSPPNVPKDLYDGSAAGRGSAARDYSAGSSASSRTVGARDISRSPDRVRSSAGGADVARRTQSPGHLALHKSNFTSSSSGAPFGKDFSCGRPTIQDAHEETETEEEGGDDDDDDGGNVSPRGRSKAVSGSALGKAALSNSRPPLVTPALVQTSPSPSPSPPPAGSRTSGGPTRNGTIKASQWTGPRTSSTTSTSSTVSSDAWSIGSSTAITTPTASNPTTPTSLWPSSYPTSTCGYDSPASASEFYESGSEWDFVA
ncbi:hypothetical protein IE81DRAFT_13014 [Ceraceosorus guamensis]|uniref:Uncharacterized protein n=1 Tax=Ceraceosorus guamensis TaxID=1522189 RepID=A0A316VQ17_9BASI|nr:hypothetical protein IE81DRAFT_13014 [Ceraceosorus guamensis]PWN39677.1 hypothetical protein IE81DRAFT_13014 [Ceraceosorus guamensis]